MAARDPQPKDHTVAIIAGAVALFALLVVLAIGLEVTDSPNTMAIVGVLGTGIGLVTIGQVMQLNAAKAATAVATKAVETAQETNVRAQDIQHSLNGNFEPRVREIVGPLLDEKLDAKFAHFEETLDARIRAGITAVNANPDREAYFDGRMRGLISDELERRDVNCKVPPRRRSAR